MRTYIPMPTSQGSLFATIILVTILMPYGLEFVGWASREAISAGFADQSSLLSVFASARVNPDPSITERAFSVVGGAMITVVWFFVALPINYLISLVTGE